MKKFILALALMPIMTFPAHADDTNISIAVKSKDALFVGEAVGGAYIIVRNRLNGDILAEGRTTGGSGDRAKIMAETTARDAVQFDDQSAHFSFSLDLYEPTPVTIEAAGPNAQEQARVEASTDYLIIPGKDYSKGNGIIVELPGFIVDVTSPPVNHKAKFNADTAIPLQANIAKLCGCHIGKDSPWPPERYDVEAGIYRGDLFMAKVKMEKTDQPGIYGTNMKFQEAGTYRLVVTAFDPHTMEGGMDSTTITLEP
jgi:hypothetical protein